jgi:hypothetical protein
VALFSTFCVKHVPGYHSISVLKLVKLRITITFYSFKKNEPHVMKILIITQWLSLEFGSSSSIMLYVLLNS